MHSPKSLTGITTLLCQSILEDPVESSHITLNVPLQSVSAYFRASFPAGFENSFAVTSFTVTPKHCLGSILVEPDGEYWVEPRLFTWNSLEQYLALFQTCPTQEPTSKPVSWKSILAAFASVEIVRIDPEWDMIEIINTSGENIASEISPKILHDLN